MILGHDKEIAMLSRAVLSGRVAHAYLFSGIDGIGKGLTARWLAEVLNCEDTSSSEGSVSACGNCKPCIALKDGASLNFIQIAPEKGYLKIERIRELQRELRFVVDSGWRVVVVHDADSMQKEPANAFLKTLEEPGKNTVIILLSSRPSLLLPTILSRCQRINFRPLETDTVADILERSFDLSPAAAEEASIFSMGSVTRALLAIEEGASVDRSSLLTAFLGSGTFDTVSILKSAEKLAKDDGIVWKLEVLKSFIRETIFQCFGVTPTSSSVSTSVRLTTERPLEISKALRFFKIIEDTQRNIQPPRNANKRLALEGLILELSAPGWIIKRDITA